MGKEGEIWDDSALIKAFDHAVTKYKAMNVNSGEKAIINAEENLPGAGADNGSIECGSNSEFVQNDDSLLNGLETKTQVVEPAETLVSTEDSPLELGSSAKCVGFFNIHEYPVPPTNDISATTSVSQCQNTASTDIKHQNEASCYSDGSEEYTKLMNKYYEIENQRQHIFQQLNQYSNWNNQYPFSSTSMTEEYQASVPQPYETVACSCPYGCQNWVVPRNSSPAACSDGNYIHTTCLAKCSPNANSEPKKDPDFVNMAMAAAEKALALTKEANGGTYKELGVETGQSPESKSTTDLDVVLRAWYTAGLYTGKYLSEQSSEGSKQGRGI
ncbi:uncharacterized protein LOC121801559 isoform X1 [Salvia splendens]|uniref:uncharacterized protein LOC121801559 isoform X1 n=1 Tax=Salvia splendens TaxID=180675 RepID=UPI001C26F6F4|nr:uncharacterized protein LOC121801559 isoform X1 [Salvia splendens]